MQAFDYISATSLEQAITLLDQNGEHARPLSGGTDLIVQLRGGQRRAKLLVDIKSLAELNQLAFDPLQGLTIGAAVPCARLCNDPTFCQHYPGLLDAVSLIGGVQIQSRATLGGNLCNASPAADSIPALIVHQAVCTIVGPGGNSQGDIRQGDIRQGDIRPVPIESFCTAPGKTVLQAGELLVSLHLPPPPAHHGAAYIRFTPRSEMDIAVVGAAAALTVEEDGTTLASARLALGAVAPTPLFVPQAGEFLKGKPATAENFVQAARIAQEASHPISDLRGTSAFRKHLCAVLVRRALQSAFIRSDVLYRHHP